MRRITTSFAVFGFSVTAAQGAAQMAPMPEAKSPAVETATVPDETAGDAIIVTGRTEPPTRRESYEQARDLSRIGRYQLDEEPLARFESPLCPGVSGLKTEAAEMMVSRIRENAAGIDVKLAKPNCAPNLIVAFVADGRTTMAKMAETHRKMFCTLPASEQSELLAEDAPVRVWNQIIVVGPQAYVWRCRWHLPSTGHVAMLLSFRRDIVSSLVLFDRDAVAGMTLVQLADYATMRGLSHTRPADGEEPMPTILALFANDASYPEALTSFDIGYLRSLYWWKPNLTATTKLLGVRERALREEDSADSRE